MVIKQFGNLKFRIFNDLEELSKEAAKIFVIENKRVQNTKEIFTVSLCGGSTPKRLFEFLATEFKDKISWHKVHIFFGDERERKENPESNWQCAYNLWLQKIVTEIPPFEKNLHRIKMELGLKKGAKEYEKEINKWTPQGFDLAFNGMGSDGHRNGIFPENPKIKWRNKIWDLSEKTKVFGYEVPPEINPHQKRITLTAAFLNKSKTNVLMIAGKEKAEVLKKIIFDKEKYNKKELPAITFNEVPTVVLADKTAASKIL